MMGMVWPHPLRQAQGCEANQAKGLAVANGASASVCLEKPVLRFVYLAVVPPTKVTGYSTVILFK